MDRRLLAALTLLLSSTAAPSAWAEDAAPATTQESQQQLDELREKEFKEQEAEIRSFPVVKYKQAADVVRISIDKQDLQLLTALPPRDSDVRIDLASIKKSIITAGATGTQPSENTFYEPVSFKYIQFDYSDPSVLVSSINILLSPGYLQLARDIESSRGMLNVSLIQSNLYALSDDGDEDKVKFNVSDTGDQPSPDDVDLKLAARSFVELRQKYPAETTKYLEPILQALGQSAVLFYVDPKAAWQVFGGSAEVSADVQAKLSDLVKQLDAESPKTRDAASKQLEEIGEPAAIVLMQLNRKGLSEEQTSRIDTFLAPFRPLDNETADRLRDDLEFATMTLTTDDPDLRKLALDAVKKIAKAPVSFDLSADTQTRMKAAIALRDSLRPKTTAPTNAATGETPASDIEKPSKPSIPDELRDAAP